MSGVDAGVRHLFAHRNYRLFFAGQSVSLTGAWTQQVARLGSVLRLTGDFFVGVIQSSCSPSCSSVSNALLPTSCRGART